MQKLATALKVYTYDKKVPMLKLAMAFMTNLHNYTLNTY